MLDYIIPLVVAWLPFWSYLIPILALSFVATVPCVIRGIFRSV